jgi:hypothetical protein
MEMRYQSEGAIATGAIRSMVVDEMGNWSSGTSEIYLVDWTAPELVYLYDGSGSDIDTTYSSTLEANWQATDVHSSIGHYDVAIGVLPSLNSVMNWTNVSLNEVFSYVLNPPVYDQVFNISLRITNGAGLESLYVSDGQRLLDPSTIGLQDDVFSNIQLYPNPVSDELHIEGATNEMNLFVYDSNGKLIHQQNNFNSATISVVDWALGTYNVILKHGESFIVKRIVVQ